MSVKRTLTISILTAMLVAPVWADTLEMRDGSLVEGQFVGGSQSTVRFEINGEVKVISVNDVLALTFTGGGAPSAAAAPAAAAPAAEPAPAAAPASSALVVPAGTRMMVRMTQTIDSKQHKAGYRFTTRLEADLMAGGQVVAPKGSTVYGKIIESKSSRRATGKSEMAITFTDISIDGQMHAIVASGIKTQSESTGKKTAGRTARAAAVGGLIDGSSGAKTGAKVGVGVSILTGGQQIHIPSGTLLEFQLQADLKV
jgi:hypothetical protein